MANAFTKSVKTGRAEQQSVPLLQVVLMKSLEDRFGAISSDTFEIAPAQTADSANIVSLASKRRVAHADVRGRLRRHAHGAGRIRDDRDQRSSVPELRSQAVRGCMSARAQDRRANRPDASFLVRFLALSTICVCGTVRKKSISGRCVPTREISPSRRSQSRSSDVDRLTSQAQGGNHASRFPCLH